MFFSTMARYCSIEPNPATSCSLLTESAVTYFYWTFSCLPMFSTFSNNWSTLLPAMFAELLKDAFCPVTMAVDGVIIIEDARLLAGPENTFEVFFIEAGFVATDSSTFELFFANRL